MMDTETCSDVETALCILAKSLKLEKSLRDGGAAHFLPRNEKGQSVMLRWCVLNTNSVISGISIPQQYRVFNPVGMK